MRGIEQAANLVHADSTSLYFLSFKLIFMFNTLSDFTATDRQSFIRFIDLLRQDFIDNPEGWENKTIDTFLAAISSYADDIQGYYDNMKQNVNADKASWQIFADILKGATLYE